MLFQTFSNCTIKFLIFSCIFISFVLNYNGIKNHKEIQMEESINYVEYTVTQKAEGKFLKNKIIVLAVYALVILAYLGIMTVLKNFGVLVAIITVPFIPLTIMLLRVLVWNRFVAIERKYEIVSAKLRISTIYGRKKEEVVFENLISEFSVIAPMDEAHKEQWKNGDTIIDYRGSIKTPDGYFARLEKDGKVTVIYFEVIEKMIKRLRFYNSSATVESKVRY